MSALRDSEEPLLSLGRRLGGKTYWDYVLPALARHRCMAPLFHEYGIFMNTANPLYKDPAEFKVTRVTARELTESEVMEQAEREMKKETLENWNPGRVFDSEIREEIQRRFFLCISLSISGRSSCEGECIRTEKAKLPQ